MPKKKIVKRRTGPKTTSKASRRTVPKRKTRARVGDPILGQDTPPAPAAMESPAPRAKAERSGFDLAVSAGLVVAGAIGLRWSSFVGVTLVVLGVHLALHSLSSES